MSSDTTAELVASRNALRESDAKFRTLADAMPQMVWSALPDGFHDYYNQRWYEFTGVPEGSTDGEEWNGMFHPEDQERAWARWNDCLQTGEPYEIEYRLRHRSGAYRWTMGRAMPLRDGDGKIVRWLGTCTDIDDAKRQAEQNEILTRELSHRIKNIFAVIAGLIGLSARTHPESKGFADDLRLRVGALGRAHELARPHSEESRMTVEASSLHGMLREMLSPYPALSEGRIHISGDDVDVDDRGATPLALVFHELATNATKYGALSTTDGRIEIETVVDEAGLRLCWRERGGPRINGAPDRQGFGTRLTEISVAKQLDGSIERQWDEDGLSVVLKLLPARLSRAAPGVSRTIEV